MFNETDNAYARFDFLKDRIGVEVQFANDCVGDDAEAKAAALQPGEVLMLENLRFHAEEEGKPRNIADNATEEEKAEASSADSERRFRCSCKDLLRRQPDSLECRNQRTTRRILYPHG